MFLAALRLLAGLASVAAGFVAAVAVIAASGGPDLAAALLAMVLLLLGFLGLGVVRTPSAPLRAMRVALTIGVLVTGYLLSGLPWPPDGDAAGSFAVLAAGLLLAISALVAIARDHPRLGSILLLPGGVYGVLMLANFGRTMAAAQTAPAPLGPAATLSFMLAASMAAAWVTAAWYARPLLAAFGSGRDAAT